MPEPAVVMGVWRARQPLRVYRADGSVLVREIDHRGAVIWRELPPKAGSLRAAVMGR